MTTTDLESCLVDLFVFERINPHKGWLTTFTADYYIPNRNGKQDYLFFDALISYRPSEKKYELGFTLKNILNVDTFTKVDINDYSTTIYRTNVIPRYYLLYFTYRF